jgi:uncharacterized protein (DUF433 family)
MIKLVTVKAEYMPVLAPKSYIEYRSNAYWVEGTRISLDSIVYAFQKGLSPESIVQSFPLLTLEQVYGVIAFYLSNRTEIDAYLVVEEEAFDAMPQPLQTTAPVLYNKLMAAKQRGES